MRTAPSAAYSQMARLSQRYVYMRCLSRPGRASTSGSALKTSEPCPVRAQASSQPMLNAINATVDSTATARVADVIRSGVGGTVAELSAMFGMIAAMTVSKTLKTPLSELVAGPMQSLRNWPWFETLRTLRARFREDRLGLTASSLTFTTLISMVPLVTVMLAVFTAFPMFGTFQAGLEKYFLQTLVPPNIAKPVLGALTMFAAKASRLGTFGLIALGFTAMALMLTIDRTLNAIWRVKKPRPIAQRVLIYWTAVTLGPLFLGASLTFTSYAISASSGMVRQMNGGVSFSLSLVEFFAFAGAISAMYHYVPNTPVAWRHAVMGGLFVAAGMEIARRTLGWYLAHMTSYSSVYGAFATLPIFLLWIYLGWVIVLLGAVIAAYAPSLRLNLVTHARVPGHRFALALEIVRRLQRSREAGEHGMSSIALADSLRMDPLQFESVLEALVALDWVGRLEEEGQPRHVLLCDPAHAPLRPLVDALLLAPIDALGPVRGRLGIDGILLADALPE
jgi:membrane protein